MIKDRKLIIIGDSSFAEIAYEYFTHDSRYEVVAFSVEQQYLKKEKLFNLPVVPFEELNQHFPAPGYYFFVATVYTQLNRLRTRLYLQAKAMNYLPASYISPRAFVWRNCEIGEHCFIFEDNVIQPFVKIGNNVILWSGNHIGHHSTVKDNCFIASHVVISGHCEIQENCFFGVNSTTADNIVIAKDCLIGASAFIAKNTEPGLIYKGNQAAVASISSYKYFKLPEPTPHEMA